MSPTSLTYGNGTRGLHVLALNFFGVQTSHSVELT